MTKLVDTQGNEVVRMETPLTPSGYGQTQVNVIVDGRLYPAHLSQVRWTEGGQEGHWYQGSSAKVLIKTFNIPELK